jgi:hypothetical protein
LTRELVGFLNNTFYPDTGKDAKHGYSPQLVSLEIQGNNLTLKGKNTVLRRITSYAGKPGKNVRLEGLQFIDPGCGATFTPSFSKHLSEIKDHDLPRQAQDKT